MLRPVIAVVCAQTPRLLLLSRRSRKRIYGCLDASVVGPGFSRGRFPSLAFPRRPHRTLPPQLTAAAKTV